MTAFFIPNTQVYFTLVTPVKPRKVKNNLINISFIEISFVDLFHPIRTTFKN